jgi:hypothetical protein
VAGRSSSTGSGSLERGHPGVPRNVWLGGLEAGLPDRSNPPTFPEGRAEFGLGHPSGSSPIGRLPFREAEDEEPPAGSKDGRHARRVDRPVVVQESVEHSAIGDGIEPFAQSGQFEGRLDREMRRRRTSGRLLLCPPDRQGCEIDPPRIVASRSVVERVLPRPAPDVEDSSADLPLRFEFHELPLGAADLPRRRALVGSVEKVHPSRSDPPPITDAPVSARFPRRGGVYEGGHPHGTTRWPRRP